MRNKLTIARQKALQATQALEAFASIQTFAGSRGERTHWILVHKDLLGWYNDAQLELRDIELDWTTTSTPPDLV